MTCGNACGWDNVLRVVNIPGDEFMVQLIIVVFTHLLNINLFSLYFIVIGLFQNPFMSHFHLSFFILKTAYYLRNIT